MPLSAVRWQLALGFGLTLLCGCEQLWSGKTKDDPRNCVAISDLCPQGQHCNLATEVCELDGAEDPDLGPGLPAAPVSYIFPGGAGGVVQQATWPRDIKIALATQDPKGTIHYTTDGTAPAPGMSGTKSEVVPALNGIVPGGTTIRWFGDYGPAFALEPIHVYTLNTSAVPPDTFGFIPEPVIFTGQDKPIIEVAPSTVVTGNILVQLWSSTPTGYCPGCIVQWVVSVEGVGPGPVTCVDGVNVAGYYPGAIGNVPISFTAPAQPGRYRVYSGLTLQFSCDGTQANGPDLGLVIVK